MANVRGRAWHGRDRAGLMVGARGRDRVGPGGQRTTGRGVAEAGGVGPNGTRPGVAEAGGAGPGAAGAGPVCAIGRCQAAGTRLWQGRARSG
jgi:hypothetical protein